MSCPHNYQRLDLCPKCSYTLPLPRAQNFQVSDTPRSGPDKISGHPGTPGPHNNKEIA